MKMKKWILLILPLLILILLVAGAVYKCPLTLTQLYPEVGLDLCKNITAYYSVDKAGEDKRVVFPSESEEFDFLMEKLKHQQFRKSFQNFLPSGTKAHRCTEGDFRWEITLEFEGPILMKDESIASGSLIRLTNFFGNLTIYNIASEQSIQCHTSNQQQWAEEILHILSGE